MDPSLAVWYLEQGGHLCGGCAAEPFGGVVVPRLVQRLADDLALAVVGAELPAQLAERCVQATAAARMARDLAAARRPELGPAAYWHSLWRRSIQCVPAAHDGPMICRALPSDGSQPAWLSTVAGGGARDDLDACQEQVDQSMRQDADAAVQQWVTRQEQQAWSVLCPPIRPLLAPVLRLVLERQQQESDFQQRLEVEKLAAMRELAYGASHEINNPLANISSRAQLLLRDERDPERRRSLATINSQAFRAFEMLADLMLFAKPPAMERQSLDLGELLRQVMQRLEELSPPGIVCELQLDEPTLIIEGDAAQLAAALQAIGQNALEAMEAAGHLRCRLRRVPASAWQHAAPGEVEIEMCDTGPGLTPRQRQHMFDPFFCGREAGRGLGLGLTKAWKIVQLHGGQLLAPPQEGRGATFVVRLPVTAAASPVSASDRAAAWAAESTPLPAESTAAPPSPDSDPANTADIPRPAPREHSPPR